MKLLATATIEGFEFTFERSPCRSWCQHTGRPIGASNRDNAYSTRIGVCTTFRGNYAEVWSNSLSGKNHISSLVWYRQEAQDKQSLFDEAQLRPGDLIRQEYSRKDDSYLFRVTGLTRDQALRGYAAALAKVDLIPIPNPCWDKPQEKEE